MDGLVLLGIIGVVFFFLGPIGFFVALRQGRRIGTLEREIARLRADLMGAAATVPPKELEEQADVVGPATGPTASAGLEAGLAAGTETEPVAPPPLTDASASATFPPRPAAPAPDTPPPPKEAAPTAPPPSPPARPRPSLEEALGTRWTVWVGGAALALGAVLLVRYSIEQGYFGPGTRVVLGLVISAALVGAGEFLRRREAPTPLNTIAGVNGAYIPGVLTAAGVTGAFGATYAAHALYAFIDARTAFPGLGIVALGAIAAAMLHGPALAGLGLLGALATPLLVSSALPNPWPVVFYLAVVVPAAYALARLRRWLWLAAAAAIGAGLWTLLLDASSPVTGVDAAYSCLIVQLALAGLVFAILPHRSESDETAEFDPVASIVLVGFALLAIVVLAGGALDVSIRSSWIVASVAAMAILSFVGAQAAPAAAASGLAGVVAVAAMRLWPFARATADRLDAATGGVIVEHAPARIELAPLNLLFAPLWPGPQNAPAFVGFSTLTVLGVATLAGWRLRSGDKLKALIATIYAGAATLTPLGAVAIADMRLAQGAASGAMALAAALIGGEFLAAARLFRDGFPHDAPPAVRIGLGAFSAGAVAALSSGLVFALDGGALTVSLALAALASAFVADRLGLPALRWCVAALGLVIAGRLAYEPRIVGAALSPTPIFNWLLFGYGVPAASFAYAGRLLRRQADDIPARAADALAVLFAAFLVFFEIRHALNGGDPFAPASGLIEQGLMSVSAFGFAIVLTRLDATRANIVFRWASLGAGALGLAGATLGLLLLVNPLFDETPVEGGLVINALLIGYLLPAGLACVLAVYARGRRPLWYWGGAGLLSAALLLTYLLLQTRVIFHGSDISWKQPFTLGETGVEICILLLCALVPTALFPRAAPVALATNIFAGAALVCAAAALGVLVNPVVSGEPIGGSAFWNLLLIAYAAPAALCAALANLARRLSRMRLAQASSIAAILLVFAYATLETRRAFHGPAIGWDLPTSDAEYYAYSAVWLLLGLALLAYGLWRKSREARLASAFFVIVTTLKVFVFDLAGLQGVLRALSFLGLGVALIGIGLVYQRVVFARPKPLMPQS